MQEQVQQLIAEGRTEDALALLAKHNGDAVLLQARYNQAKKQQNMGMIDFGEWSRVQSQVNYAALEMAIRLNKTVVTNNTVVVFNYFNFERQPGNDVGTVNKVYTALHKMKDDFEYPLNEIEKGVDLLNKVFGIPELIDKVEEFQKSKYRDNTEAYKTQKRGEFVEYLLSLEEELKTEIKRAVAEEQKTTGWREAINLVISEPTKARWENTHKLITERLDDPIFTSDQRETWRGLVSMASEIPEGLLWARKFKSVLADIQTFIRVNVR